MWQKKIEKFKKLLDVERSDLDPKSSDTGFLRKITFKSRNNITALAKASLSSEKKKHRGGRHSRAKTRDKEQNRQIHACCAAIACERLGLKSRDKNARELLRLKGYPVKPGYIKSTLSRVRRLRKLVLPEDLIREYQDLWKMAEEPKA